MSFTDRFLVLAADPDEPDVLSKLTAFRSFLLMHIGVEAVLGFHATLAGRPESPYPEIQLLLWLAVTLACLVGIASHWARGATTVVCGLWIVDALLVFPSTANHTFIEVVCLIAFVFLDLRKSGERAVLRQTLGWFFVIVLVYTGVQKVLYNTYFDGQMLGVLIAEEDRFAWFFQWILSSDEFNRLRALGPIPTEWGQALPEGAYRIDSIPVVMLSNATYVLEMLLPILLLVPRMRSLAITGIVLLILAIEIGAREITFGALAMNLVLLFAKRDWNRRLLPFFAVLYAGLVVLRIVGGGWFEFVI